MPAKKKATTKKKTTTKKKVVKKTVKKVTAKKTDKKAAPVKKAEKPAPPPAPIKKVEEKPKKVKKGISCAHCDATGVCAAGDPYDKTRGKIFSAKTRLRSCVECLLANGQHKNSKKLVDCRLCDGDGEI